MNTHLVQNQDVKNKTNQGTKKLEQKYFSCLYMNGRTLGNKKDKLELVLLFYDLASITETWEDGKICMSEMLNHSYIGFRQDLVRKKVTKSLYIKKGELPAPEFSGDSERKHFACSQIHVLTNKSTKSLEKALATIFNRPTTQSRKRIVDFCCRDRKTALQYVTST